MFLWTYQVRLLLVVFFPPQKCFGLFCGCLCAASLGKLKTKSVCFFVHAHKFFCFILTGIET